MAVNRERKMINVYTGNDLDLENVTLKNAATRIHHLIKLYGENAQIKVEQYGTNDEEYLAIYWDRPETDAERDARIAKEEKIDIWHLQKEREMYERLRAKFEGK